MHWNHRLIDMTAQNDGEHWLEIKEVFYEDDKPQGYASALVGGETASEVRETLTRMLSALDNPVLTLTKEGELK
jgi:hypothetical protein